MRILFIARSLARGGAERQLVALTTALARRGHSVAVACFYPGGVFEAEVRAAGIELLTPGKRGRWDLLGFFWRLRRITSEWRPDVVHGYTVTPNLVAWALVVSGLRARLVFGLRASKLDLTMYDWLTGLSFRLSSLASRRADLLIANSEVGRTDHIAAGMPAAKLVVIPNGIDAERFVHDPGGRVKHRREWGIEDHQILVGLVGRWDLVKDHSGFLQAAALVAQEVGEARFICIGGDAGDLHKHLAGEVRARRLTDKVLLVEGRGDVSAIYSALDLLCLSSRSEGFPNVVGEAMACGTPCVVTAVGDAAVVVGDTGRVVPPHDPPALAAGIIALCRSDRAALGTRATARIRAEYSIERLVARTEQALERVTREPAR